MAALLKDKRTPITTPPYQVPNVDVTPDPPIFSLVTTFKMKISPIKNPNFEKPSRTLSYRTKVEILKTKMFWISLKKNLIPRMLSHRGNVRTSKFLTKIEGKEAKFFSKIYKGHISI